MVGKKILGTNIAVLEITLLEKAAPFSLELVFKFISYLWKSYYYLEDSVSHEIKKIE